MIKIINNLNVSCAVLFANLFVNLFKAVCAGFDVCLFVGLYRYLHSKPHPVASFTTSNITSNSGISNMYNNLKLLLIDRINFQCISFERNRQIGIPYNLLNTYKSYSSLATQSGVYSRPNKFLINPWFISGFTDAEGCFTLFINRNNKHSIGWEVKVSFQINIHKKDLFLLVQIQSYFGVGSISRQGEFTYQYRVQSIKDMASIIKHFYIYPPRSDAFWKTNWLWTHKESFLYYYK